MKASTRGAEIGTGEKTAAKAFLAAKSPDPTANVEIGATSSGYCLHTRIWLPRPIDEVFAFFADAGNLEEITPQWLEFRILTPLPVVMRAGLRLDYRLRFRGVPISWQSEIAVWEPPSRFVDVQRKGPYRSWVHDHRFDAREGGTEVVDRVDYAVPGGRIVHGLFVERHLRSIFRYRQLRMTERLGPELGRTSRSVAVDSMG